MVASVSLNSPPLRPHLRALLGDLVAPSNAGAFGFSRALDARRCSKSSMTAIQQETRIRRRGKTVFPIPLWDRLTWELRVGRWRVLWQVAVCVQYRQAVAARKKAFGTHISYLF